jgi:hypothetical protein
MYMTQIILPILALAGQDNLVTTVNMINHVTTYNPF